MFVAQKKNDVDSSVISGRNIRPPVLPVDKRSRKADWMAPVPDRKRGAQLSGSARVKELPVTGKLVARSARGLHSYFAGLQVSLKGGRRGLCNKLPSEMPGPLLIEFARCSKRSFWFNCPLILVCDL